MDRRTVLLTLGTGLAAGVAGCADGGNDAPTATTADGRTSARTTSLPMETPTETPTGTATDRGTESPTSTSPPVAQTVEVGADGFTFVPSSFEIAVGETVRWMWVADNHNVVPNDVPTAADWQGSRGAPEALHDEGHTETHTFEIPGPYSYHCRPHRTAGMQGSFTVTE